MKQERYDIIKQLIDIEYWNIDINKGTVTPKKTKRVPVKAKSMEEYDSISLVYAGKQYRFYVHQIIAIAGGMDPVGYQITHKNGDIHDNSFSNLKLIDTLHEIKYGLPETKRVKTDLTCEKHPRAKLSNDDVAYIKYRLECKTQVKILADLYKVTNMVITRIKLNNTWKQIKPFQEEKAKSYEISDRGRDLGLS